MTRFTCAVAAFLLAGQAFAAPPPPPPEITPATKFKPGSGFTLVNGDDFSLQVTGRIQARYTYENFDKDRNTEDASFFTAERVRFGAKGTMFKDWRFEFQADFGKGAIQLRDAVIIWGRVPEFNINMGQFKTRFDRQQYTSSGRQMFADRSIASREFGGAVARDIGLMFDGAAWDRKFQYNVGVFDGQGIPHPSDTNKNDGHLTVARISFNPNGDFGVLESDIKKTDYHLWYIDLAGYWNNDVWKDANTDKQEQPDELTDTNSWTFGFGYKHAGVYLAGEYYDRNVEKEDGTGNKDSDGWYMQLGYTFIRDKWEIAFRWSEVDPDDSKEDDVRTEQMIGINRYFKNAGHSLKLNTDLSWLDEEKAAPTDDLEDFRLRSQLQIVF